MGFFNKLVTDFIAPPISYDEEGKKIIASYLKVILIVAISVFPVYIIFKVVESDRLYPADFIIGGLAVFYVSLLWFINKGRVLIPGILFLLSGWTALTIMASYADGIKDIAIVGYIIVIFLATLLTGIRFAFVITAISIIAVWIMGISQANSGFIPEGDAPLNYSRDYTVLFILVLTAISLFARSYRYSFDRINRELKERIKAEEKLSKNEISLLEKNEELRAAKEKAEESDRLKTAFLQNISHEIRTPMNGIVGFLELLQLPDTDSRKKEEYIGIINSCTQQLAALVNDLIDISRIESGTIELYLSEFETENLLKNIQNIHSKIAHEKGLKFKVINNLPGYRIKSDEGKIKQVLDNLVSNAVKFTDKGSITINLSRERNDLVFSVTDTGIGIKESDQELIFDRFRQSEMGLNRTYGGSGIGLAISKGNINFLGGKLWLESTPGKGSTFTFTIPVEFLAKSSDNVKVSDHLEFSKRIKILTVEDDEINFLYVRELLRDLDCELIRAKNGAEAVQLFTGSKDFDIILMDLKMPVMGGYEATREIRNINPAIPVIAVSSFDLQEDIMGDLNIRFNAHVIKPIVKNDLLMKINSLLN